MCLAPRYINGPMACPCSPWRNTASLPDTPCASSAAEPSSTKSAAMAALLTLIPVMAGVAGLVDDVAGLEDAVGAPGLSRLERHLPGGHERLRHRDPVATIDRPVAHQQQVARLDERRRLRG